LLSKLFKKFKKTNYPITDFYHTDLHSHLIPGIDDGVKTIDESISIIKQMKALGYSKLITTPHIMMHRFPNSKDIIFPIYEELKEEIEKQNINIELDVSAEYYYDEFFVESIRKKDLFTFGDNYVLFEFSYTTKPFALEQTVYELLNAGYKPILAHPERYTCFSTNLEKYHYLKELGLLFQINLNSLHNFYGKKPKKASEYLVDNHLVDFVGSDIHSMKYFDSLKSFTQTNKLKEVFEKNQIKNDFI
jgi:tyrosine-protein phosphatase YwqE